MRSGLKAIVVVALAGLSVQALAIPVRTGFIGQQSNSGGLVEGYFQYDMSEAIPDSDSNEYSFNGGSTLFFARKADGEIFTGNALYRVSFRNDSPAETSVACGERGPFDSLQVFAAYDDHIQGSTGQFYFSVYDCSGNMFSPDVTTLPQTNIPLSIDFPTNPDGLFQFDEEMTGSLGGFRIRSLTPLSAVPEPETLGLFCLGLVVLGFTRQRRQIPAAD